MGKLLIYLISALLIFMMTGCSIKKIKNSSKSESKNRKGILVVSFGTSYLEAGKLCIESTENKIKKNFPHYEARRAFTSDMIIKKLKERDNIHIDTVHLALDKMKKDGFTEVIVQPLHIMPGEEYDGVIDIVKKYTENKSFTKLVLGRPILYRTEDYAIAIEALKSQLPKMNNDEAVILMGHGSAHPGNSSYSQLQYMLNENEMKNVYVGTVEGYPTLDNIIPKLKSACINKVTLMPFMLAAGDHANNDMAGNDKNSWKSILQSNGFKVETYIHGLGENEKFQDIYVQHVKDCINGNL